MRLILILVLLLAGCHKTSKQTHNTFLQDYARHNKIPEEILDEHGDNWPQFIYDFSISHGPLLNKNEMEEFNSWKN